MDLATKLLNSTSRELLFQLRAVPLIRDRVLRQLRETDQQRIAERIAASLVRLIFSDLASSIERHDRARETAPSGAPPPEPPAPGLRWCLRCDGWRYWTYRNRGRRCEDCDAATVGGPPAHRRNGSDPSPRPSLRPPP